MKKIVLFVHRQISKPTTQMVLFCVVVIVLLTDFLLMIQINAREVWSAPSVNGLGNAEVLGEENEAKHETISEEDIQALREHLEVITLNQYPSAALYRFKKVRKEKQLDDATCFELAKFIGEKSFGKYKNLSRALQYKDPLCGNGYVFGVIAGYISASSNIFLDAQDVCAKVPPDEWPLCYEAVGTGFMGYNKGDADLSRAMCEIFMSDDAVMKCVGGVIEN